MPGPCRCCVGSSERARGGNTRYRQFVLGAFAVCAIGSATTGSARARGRGGIRRRAQHLFREFEARDCAGRQATGCVEGLPRIKRDGRCARFTSSSPFSLTHSSRSFSLSLWFSLCPPPSFLLFQRCPSDTLAQPTSLSLSPSQPPPPPPRSARRPVPLALARSRSLLPLSRLLFSLPLTVAVSLALAIHVPPPSYPPSGGLDSVEKKRRFGG